jgi:hypothetical protein
MIEESQNLERMLKDYHQGVIDRQELEGNIFMYIRKHPRRFSQVRWREDAWDDFISWIYPRLSKAVDRYEDRGSSFDAYIITMLRLSAKEYALRKREHRIIEKTWWNAHAEEMAAYEPEEPDYFEEKPPLQKISNPRQVLILLLKSYYYLSDDLVSRLAPALGLEKEELLGIVDELREIRTQREERINSLKERIHCQFYRCLAFEKLMLASPLHSPHRIKMARCLENARKRLISMRRRLSLMRIGASNEQVARVLKVAKGTIDSNLYTVRHKNQIENQ